ncbi:type II secretion system protein N [Hydrogenophaga sp.]|uniref:type II secretion system protein N n=1 Tax=Hydrogenophaga sp. TaxID=1904254 RepID=UPI003F6BE7E4
MTQASSFSHSVYPGDGHASALNARRPWAAAAAGMLWLAAGLSAGYWVLLAWGRTPVTAVAAAPMALPVADPAVVARALGFLPPAVSSGVAQAPVAVPSRYVLLGVVAVGAAQGAALIGLDGQPPRPYRVGAVLDGGLVLQAVSRTTARLGPTLQGPATVELSLPEMPATAP